MPHIEVDALDVLVLKKLVLINAALAKALTDPRAAREQSEMTRHINALTLRADLAVKSAISTSNQTVKP